MITMQGFLNIYKPSGVSSAKIVSAVKKLCKGCKVGHMGTLDPMACGVLPIAINKATKMFDYFLDKYKTYRAVFTFGYETDTLDALGTVVKENGNLPTVEQINNVINCFVGNIMQTPPSYSAKNVNGTRAYKLARKGEQVELPPKQIVVNRFELVKQIDNNSFEFLIECGSGTYIRSLCRDLAYALNTYATMTFLQREISGAFKVENAIKIENLNAENLLNNLVAIDKVFSKYKVIETDEIKAKKLLNGLAVLNTNNPEGNYFVKHNDELLGLGKVEQSKLKLTVYLKEN